MDRKLALIFTIAVVAFMAVYPVLGAAVAGVDILILDSLVDRYGPVKFNHVMHATYVSGACGNCHHQHEEFENQPCKGCHSLDAVDFKRTVVNTYLPCRSCHAEFDPSVPGMPGLKVAYHQKCFKCHRGMGNVGKSPAGCTEQCHASMASLQGAR